MEENKVLKRKQKNDVNDGSFELESDGLGSFRFPFIDDVPAGYYVSYIVNAEKTVTRSGEDTILVYYEIEPYSQCKARMNNRLPKYHQEEYYYIIQSYPYGTPFIRGFKDAMSTALFGDTRGKFTQDDVVGVEEVVNLTYANVKSMGGFSSRRPLDPQELIDKPKEEVEEIECEEYVEEAGCEYDW